MAGSHLLTTSRVTSRRNPLGRYNPKRLTVHARWRFVRDRRAALIRQLGAAPPDDRQASLIQSMIDAEWSALVCDRDAAAAPDAKARHEALKLAGEHRRLLLLLDRDFQRSIPPPAPKPQPPTLAEIIARRAAQREPAA